MIIKIENTSDKNVCNFYLEDKIFNITTSEYSDAKSIRKSPLAETIFDIGGVESILIASEMVSVRKKQQFSWDDLSPQIMSEILDFIASGNQVVSYNEQETKEELLRKIILLIDARIRPALNKDGGDIEIKNFDNGILWVKLTGQCANCPYAMRTLKDGVEKILIKYIPQIKEVKPLGDK